MAADLSKLLVAPAETVRRAMLLIDQNERGIVLVVDHERRLIGTVTDGDIRRAVLGGLKIDASIEVVLAAKAGSVYGRPMVGHLGMPPEHLLALMRERKIRQLPILDEAGRVVDLAMLEDLLPGELPNLRAVIMAGGKGTRLRPLTEDMPKPMLPVGDRPLMEHIIEGLRRSGIHRLNITTHYMPERIREHFGDGREFGVDIEYVAEEEPLGTAGALGLIDRMDEPMLVINGDVLTQVNFEAMLAYHREHKADLTVGVRQYDVNVPYGVVENQGSAVQRIVEKPVYSFFVNAGIYLLEPRVHQLIPRGARLDMPDLVQMLLAQNHAVVSFPILEYWLDVGQRGDYDRAQEDIKTWGDRK